MSTIIEDFYYGNIEPQEVKSELTSKLKKKLSNLAEKEEQLTARLAGEDKELFQNYVNAYIEFSTIAGLLQRAVSCPRTALSMLSA